MAIKKTLLSRQAFLKVAGVNLAAFSLLKYNQPAKAASFFSDFSRVDLNVLPERVANILYKVTNTTVDDNGQLALKDADGQTLGYVPVAQTRWNRENSSPIDRLDQNKPWGIVLHWFGDVQNNDRPLAAYMRGFDGLREADGYKFSTSAHFLIGGYPPGTGDLQKNQPVGVVQTQIPDQDGTPFLASHLRSLDYLAHKEKKQYFVRAYYQLSSLMPGVHSLLQDFFDGPRRIDPNTCTIAIEITGSNFENPASQPGDQQIANVVSVVWALMKRYRIQAGNLLGHHEIQLGKPDPGKKFMALIRFLIGVKVLVDQDEQMFRQVFGPFLWSGLEPNEAVGQYFQSVRNYLNLVSTQRKVYEWEADTGFWFVDDIVHNNPRMKRLADQYSWPLGGSASMYGYTFLDPSHHEGVDFYSDRKARLTSLPAPHPIYLVAGGRCIFLGEQSGHTQGKIAVFRHRQTDGAEIVSVYSHLNGLGDLHSGSTYPLGYPVGSISSAKAYQDPFLHFAIAYGASWDANSQLIHNLPLNATQSWINERFLEPYAYLASKT
jgi:hypothetical protein